MRYADPVAQAEIEHRGEHETVWIAEVFRWATGESK